MFITTIKPSTFIKASMKAAVTSLVACTLIACGGDTSNSNNAPIINVLAPEMGAIQGRSVFSIKVSDHDLIPQAGVTAHLSPMMTMDEQRGGHMHSTPHTGCTETDSEGNASCSVYFLMASKMENGDVMGTWDLAFSLPDSEDVTTHFTPQVKMAMGDTVLAQLKGGLDDQISAMGMTESRTYHLFNNGITGSGDNRSVELFIAAKESMKSFPTLTQNLILSPGTDQQMSVDSIQVKVSSDNSNWINAAPQGAGIWQATEISGLNDTLYVSLTVNGEIKTRDGEVAGENNASAIFTLSSNM